MQIIDQRHFGVIDGFDIKATLVPDQDATPYEADCYSEADIKAWKSDQWSYVIVVVTASIDGHEFGNATLGAVESGDLAGTTINPLHDVVSAITDNGMIYEAVIEAKRNAAELRIKLDSVSE